MNKARLIKLADRIAANPKKYDQTQWSYLRDVYGESFRSQDEQSKVGLSGPPTVGNPRAPNCGSAGCIAGHAAVMDGYLVFENSMCVDPSLDPKEKRPRRGAAMIARDYLGLTNREADVLFDGKGEDWPVGYDLDGLSNEEQAAVAEELLRDLASGETVLVPEEDDA